ncbi:Wzz/FepE/Etk N-terminal domain-containing protein [Marinagarivorans algicola]|uniref:Wzz/FepE/Etk N-terminal domain-containing protein n=1 Tax=Marinagarivorans algicola TaxID=1513270 RepID=UPI0006B921BF|nr:Wzz/FepE/Etk N-terminal domain-containing protein [Marinagarivorans algicola]
MNELEKKLETIEQQLQLISSNQSSIFGNTISPRSDEIDLRELFSILWQGKWWVIGVTLLFAVVGIFYAKSLPNMYKSEGIYAPAQKQGGAGGLGDQLGGLASFAGVNLGGGKSNDIDQAIALVTSWPFLERIIEVHDLKPLIMGVEAWNHEAGELIWDDEIYDPVNKKWLRVPANGKGAEPSSFEVYSVLRNMLSVGFDSQTNMLNVTIEYYSPTIAKDWVALIVAELNDAFRVRDMSESKKNIEYLEKKISETSVTEMQAVFYGMIEAQMKTLMLAEVEEQYLIKQVIQPKIPEVKSQPKRALICVLFVILGGFVALSFVLVRGFWLKSGKVRIA